MAIRLSYAPRAWQSECHRKRRRFSVFVLHRRAGKTEFAIMELVNAAMRCTTELGAFAYIAPLLKQAKRVVWRRIKHRLREMIGQGLVEVSESELTLNFTHNDATISLYGADNPDALRGIYLDGVVLDEVAQMEPEVWDEVVRPTLADRRGWAIFIGTVKSTDLFSETYARAVTLVAKGSPDWFAASWTCYETDALDPAEIESLRDELSENAFRREMLNDFDAQGADQLISGVDVRMAMNRSCPPADIIRAPRILGVDPARFGNDRSVIARRQGLQVWDPTVRHGIDNMMLAALVAQEIEDWQPDAVFIDAGAGAGVIDRLRMLGHRVVEVPFGGNAIDQTRYADRRTEMWVRMADWIGLGGTLPTNPKLRLELTTPTYGYDKRDRRLLEPKDATKKRLPKQGSPDLADAVALTFAAPVPPKSEAEVHGLRHVERRTVEEPNPYAKFLRERSRGAIDAPRRR